MKTLTLLLLGLTFSLTAHGEVLDAASQEALQKTQQLLTSPEQRQDYINKSGKAASADKMVDQIGGDSMAKEGVYKLAGDVFAELVKETNGDPEKMQKILAEVARDPASFKTRFTPEQLARLKQLANQMQPANRPK